MLRRLFDEFMDDPLSFVLFGLTLALNVVVVALAFVYIWQEVTK